MWSLVPGLLARFASADGAHLFVDEHRVACHDPGGASFETSRLDAVGWVVDAVMTTPIDDHCTMRLAARELFA